MKIPWNVGDKHPVFGEVQMVGTVGSEKYRWFSKNNLVSMMPILCLGPQEDDCENFVITGEGVGQSSNNKKSTTFVQVNGVEWMTVKECSKRIPPNAEGQRLSCAALSARIKKYGALDPYCVRAQDTRKESSDKAHASAASAALVGDKLKVDYSGKSKVSSLEKLDAIPVGIYDNLSLIHI